MAFLPFSASLPPDAYLDRLLNKALILKALFAGSASGEAKTVEEVRGKDYARNRAVTQSWGPPVPGKGPRSGFGFWVRQEPIIFPKGWY